jgi:hypothetical protein
MSFEANMHASLGDPVSYEFLNLAAGARLSVIARTQRFMLQPYAAVRMPFRISPEYYAPHFHVMLGGGLQVSVRGSRTGGFFFDAGIMATLNGVEMHNPRVLTPNPSRIRYNHFVVEFSLGYKFGFFERRR